MRVSLSWMLLCAMWMTLAVSSTGCRTGGWGWSPSSWTSWGSGSAGSTALASKPSTSVPRPTSTATPSPTTSLAAGAPGASNPAYNVTDSTRSVPSYPSTGYPTQPAAAYQSAGSPGQVAPTVGYQTGPYSMGAAAPTAGAATAPSSYGQTTYGAAAGVPSAQPWNSPAQPGATDGYRTAEQRSPYAPQESSPYGGASQPATGYGSSSGNYATPPSYTSPASGGSTYGDSPYSSPAGTAPSYSAPNYNTQPSYSQPAAAPPSAAEGAWKGYQAPASSYPVDAGASTTPPAQPVSPSATASTQPSSPAGYQSTLASDYAAASTAPSPAPSPVPALPSSLTTSAGGYRPGSTAGGGGVQNASYAQPNYGNTYLR